MDDEVIPHQPPLRPPDDNTETSFEWAPFGFPLQHALAAWIADSMSYLARQVDVVEPATTSTDCRRFVKNDEEKSAETSSAASSQQHHDVGTHAATSTELSLRDTDTPVRAPGTDFTHNLRALSRSSFAHFVPTSEELRAQRFTKPSIFSILSGLRHLHLPEAEWYQSMVLFDRVIRPSAKGDNFPLNMDTLRTILITCVRLANKFNNDIYRSATKYRKYARLPDGLMNATEWKILKYLDFNIYVSPDELAVAMANLSPYVARYAHATASTPLDLD